MHLAFSILLITTAIIIMIYDWKIQSIPLWLILINYSSICIINNYWLALGLLLIMILYKLDYPIDGIYLCLIGYLIIINNNYVFSSIIIFALLLWVLLSKKEKMSFMIPLELVIIIELIMKEKII